MVSLYYSLCFAASIISSVSAHGAVTGLSIAGKTFKAGDVNRSKQGQNPLHKNDGSKLICNVGASSTTKSQATANPGDKITFNWVWTTDRHPGPIDTYLAYCGATAAACNNFDVTRNVWFKIQEAGVLRDSNDFNGGFWASDKLKQDGNKWTITLPEGLKKGAYVMRHSIIAMHLTRNPEFYPFCTHLVVGGSATGAPASSQLVGIPAAFSTAASQKALDFNIFAKYKMSAFTPSGPRPVTSFGSGGGSGSGPVSGTTTLTKTTTVKKGTKTQGVAPTETEDLPECPEDPEDPVDPTADPTSDSLAAPTASATPTSDLPECPAPSEAPEDPEDPEDPEAGDPEYKRDLSAGFNAGVKAVRSVLKRMNSKHAGKRRIAEWH